MKISIKNLRVRTIIGIFDWERTQKQDVVINIRIELDGTTAAKSDRVEDTVNYNTISQRVIREVENSQFLLVEKLAEHILQLVLEDRKIRRAAVEVDKPGAIRFTDSVSVTCTGENSP
ncbi:MAG: dihydroneopterin aldolase [bacterium]|nr:dihydroneopterin aldolase [bacterium]